MPTPGRHGYTVHQKPILSLLPCHCEPPRAAPTTFTLKFFGRRTLFPGPAEKSHEPPESPYPRAIIKPQSKVFFLTPMLVPWLTKDFCMTTFPYSGYFAMNV